MNTKLQSMFIVIGLAFIAAVHQTTAQVTNLGIIPVAGGRSILYWPTSSTTHYVLQTTASLSSPNWTKATNTVTVNAVTLTNSGPAGYFHLSQSTNSPVMVLIPAGSFTIGNYLVSNFYHTPTNDPDITDAQPTNVYVSAFYMDANLVDLSLWQAVYGYATNHGYTFDDAGTGKGTNYPVDEVNWYDSVKWCNARSQEAGLTPCYYTDAGFTQAYKTGDEDNIYVKWGANGFRLPTEAEWEKAARGGQTGNRFPCSNIISEEQANYYAHLGIFNYDAGPYTGFNTNFNNIGYPHTSPVGSFAPNGYGLYDMAGNVEEWCWDWYAGPPYPAGSPYLGSRDPTGAGPGSDKRVVRGGDWLYYASYERCAYRNYSSPSSAAFNIGFRCVRGL